MKKIIAVLLTIIMTFSIISIFPSLLLTSMAMPIGDENNYGLAIQNSGQSVETTGIAPEKEKNFSLEEAKVYIDDSLEKSSESSDTIIYPDGVTFYSTNALTRASSYADYKPANAVSYALQYAENPNSSQFKTLDNDCTNFVSQAIAVGGVYSYINTSFTDTPLFRDWIYEDNPNAWYMVKKTKSSGSTYWAYSKTWAVVDNFRSFQIGRAARGSNTLYGKLSGGTPNTTANVNTNYEYKLRKNDTVGQVWQLEGKHSIIITAVTQRTDGYNYVWYSSHSENRKNEDIQTFLSWCYNNYGTTNIYSMSFS